ncbi:MAG: phosphatidylglycerol lysyltransferase domain-containing protein [Desulfarculaceae bacterium]|nr:phosphatidylglycerol lysyltransferase domain-containing protein [Desulfarculaceae bacterium]MCF8072620.1 phosphatidylglycerol lysyltransferase domain-containing protein [Desulfarculaceae bacterium]MCF8103308.1 phosphatidylglycerol lysyltransferase domain-containing protein [Desulfarculaceae bacterium]MCF8117790.1 phosphatidylglycerol lysyltransferase domain-containing protein [Desulfarculaceae bacterium]
MSPTDYQPLELSAKPVFDRHLHQGPPCISELTFSNLFMWRHHYQPLWREHGGCLLVIVSPEGGPAFGLPPAGGGDLLAACEALCRDLAEMGAAPVLNRVGERLALALDEGERFGTELDLANSDYVYLAEELADLPGRRFHRKKNHFNKFVKTHEFEYRPLEAELIAQVLDMQEKWCQIRECAADPGLASEDRAIYEALTHYDSLDYSGGVIIIEDKVAAFSLGEPLNPDTAVVHIEKANPEYDGIYAAINKLFVQNAWAHMKYINREQDLGLSGLRKAKESYQPDHMVNKYVVTPNFL